jgi:hypothetical protein
MTVRREGFTIHLEGACGVEEAETLAALLGAPGDWTVELSGCRQMHTALIQGLLRYGPAVRGTPVDPFLSRLVAPALNRAESPVSIPSETPIP